MIIKKIVLNIFIIIAILFVLDFAIGRTLRYFYFREKSGLHYRTTYAMEKTNADILIFGSSRANHHYVPEVFEDSLNMSFYNTGRDGNFIFFQTALLKSILTRYTPKIIILDIAGGFEKNNIAYERLSSLLPYYKTHKEIRKIVDLKSQFEKIKLLSEIYPFNSQLLTIAIGNFEKNEERKSDDKGYIALNKKWGKRIDSIVNTSITEIDTNKIFYLHQFIKLAKQAGSKVFLIYSPIFQKMNRNQEVEITNTICVEENVPFWDYSKDTTFLNNNQYFQDILHLNNTGAILFSAIISNRIKQNLYY